MTRRRRPPARARARFPVVAEALRSPRAGAAPQHGDARRQPAPAHALPLLPRRVHAACNKREPGTGCAALDGVNRMHAVLGTSDAVHRHLPRRLRGGAGRARRRGRVARPAARTHRRSRDLHRLPDDNPAARDDARARRADHRDPHARRRRSPTLDLPQGPRPRSPTRSRSPRPPWRSSCSTARVRDVRIALGGVGTVPWRAHAAEDSLQGPVRSTRVQPRAPASRRCAAHGPRRTTPSRCRSAAATVAEALMTARDGGQQHDRPGDRPRPAAQGRPREGDRRGALRGGLRRGRR